MQGCAVEHQFVEHICKYMCASIDIIRDRSALGGKQGEWRATWRGSLTWKMGSIGCLSLGWQASGSAETTAIAARTQSITSMCAFLKAFRMYPPRGYVHFLASGYIPFKLWFFILIATWPFSTAWCSVWLNNNMIGRMTKLCCNSIRIHITLARLLRARIKTWL